MSQHTDPDDHTDALTRIVGRLDLLVSDLQAAGGAHDGEAVRLGASEVLAELEPLQREGRESGKPQPLWYADHPGGGAGIWLIEASAHSVLEELDSPVPDWDRIAAAATFAESGVEQLQDALRGTPTDQERFRAAVAQTIGRVEERLRSDDLTPSVRTQLVERLRILKDLELE